MIRMQNVAKRYAQTGEVLSQLNLELDAGEFAFLTGASGAGKSTLLKLIALIEAPSRGSIYLNERNVTHAKRSQIAKIRSRMGLIFQDHRLLQDRNVFENVALPLRIYGYLSLIHI